MAISTPRPVPPGAAGPYDQRMVVCGDDALALRLAAELTDVYRERVTAVIPADRREGRPGIVAGAAGRGRAAALFGRMSAAIGRPPSDGAATTDARRPGADDVTVLHATEPDDEVLRAAGVAEAVALALVYDDDETNIHAALRARRLNPRVRLVIRLYNRKLGQHLEELLDQAALVAAPSLGPRNVDVSTTVLSDADTAAPALAATAVAGTRKIVQADGLLLRAAERHPVGPGSVPDPGLCTLALLSSTADDPAGAEGSDTSGADRPSLLPDDADAARATGRGTVVLEAVSAVSYRRHTSGPGRPSGRRAPLRALFSRRLAWSVTGLVAAVLALAAAASLATGDDPRHAAYLSLLDLFAMGDPAIDESTGRQLVQLLSGLTGLLLLPVLVAAALEAFGTFRTASALRRPPRRLSGHVVLLGLGKIGTRVLNQLREIGVPVVCVEEDPQARGIPLARALRVPTVLGDVSEEGVLEAAKIDRAHALLALTSADSTNLEAALYARALRPRLRVALRLYDDQFATAVYRTLRAAHPRALTRSRSVSTLAAPAFAAAMMGRQILGAIPVERRVLLFAAVEVGQHPELAGRTMAQAFRPGTWRVIALDTEDPADRQADLNAVPEPAETGDRSPRLRWDVPAEYVLRPRDRVVLAATRQGLGELLSRRPAAPAG